MNEKYLAIQGTGYYHADMQPQEDRDIAELHLLLTLVEECLAVSDRS